MKGRIGGFCALMAVAAACGSTSGTTTETISTLPPPPPQEELAATAEQRARDAVPDDAPCTPVEPGTTSILVLPPWEAGATRTFEIHAARPSVPPTLETVNLHVDDESRLGWTVTLSVERPPVPGLSNIEKYSPAVAAWIERSAPVPITYGIASDRSLSGIQNPDDIRESWVEFYDAVAIDDFSGAALGLSSYFQTAPASEFQRAAEQERTALHSLEGRAFVLDEPTVLESRMRNNYGGESFPATITLTLDELIDGDGCVVVSMEIDFDPDSYSDILIESLLQLAETNDQEVIDDIELTYASLELRNVVTGQYDAGTGFFHSITYSESIRHQFGRQIEVFTITDITETGSRG